MNSTPAKFPSRVLLWLAVALSAGLGQAVFAAEAAPAATNAFEKITYRDSGGFTGRGSGKSMVLTGGGKLDVKSRAGQARTVQLDKQELAEIQQAVAAVAWAALEKSYRTRGGADMFVNSLTIIIGGKSWQIEADEKAKLPPELKKFFKQLDATYRRALAASQVESSPK